eukprot:g8796.t1
MASRFRSIEWTRHGADNDIKYVLPTFPARFRAPPVLPW